MADELPILASDAEREHSIVQIRVSGPGGTLYVRSSERDPGELTPSG